MRWGGCCSEGDGLRRLGGFGQQWHFLQLKNSLSYVLGDETPRKKVNANHSDDVFHLGGSGKSAGAHLLLETQPICLNGFARSLGDREQFRKSGRATFLTSEIFVKQRDQVIIQFVAVWHFLQVVRGTLSQVGGRGQILLLGVSHLVELEGDIQLTLPGLARSGPAPNRALNQVSRLPSLSQP